jgi:carbonic anhydrase
VRRCRLTAASFIKPDMSAVEQLLERNTRFAASRHADLPLLPRLRACVVTCPDARVDPAHVLGLEPGDAAVVRAAGGRVSPIVLQQLLFLQMVATAEGRGRSDDRFELVLMQHTDCGIAHLVGPEHAGALAAFLGCTPAELSEKSLTDPYAAVRQDIQALAEIPFIPASLAVSALVYDVHSGLTELVERRAPLRAA